MLSLNIVALNLYFMKVSLLKSRNSTCDPLHFRAMLCAGTLGLVTVVAMVGWAAASRGLHYTEVFSSSEDGQHVLVRARRSAEVCKYKKGEWSACDTMVMVSTLIIHQSIDKTFFSHSPPTSLASLHPTL